MNHRNSEQVAIEAAVFRKLVSHLQNRSDVQNIELMNLAGFCRNCLSKWYVAASKEVGCSVEYEEARELVYGMTYHAWKTKFQTDASSEQLEKFRTENSRE